jgi:hypothetical protein
VTSSLGTGKLLTFFTSVGGSKRGGKSDSSEEEGKEIHAPEIRKYIHSDCMQGFSPETGNTFLRINSMEQLKNGGIPWLFAVV